MNSRVIRQYLFDQISGRSSFFFDDDSISRIQTNPEVRTFTSLPGLFPDDLKRELSRVGRELTRGKEREVVPVVEVREREEMREREILTLVAKCFCLGAKSEIKQEFKGRNFASDAPAVWRSWCK